MIQWLYSEDNFNFFCLLVIVLIIGLCIYRRYKKVKQYESTEYYAVTKNSYSCIMHDKGKYGEYLIYKYLLDLPENKKFLFNCYIPKDDDKTSEIDVIMLHDSGIYVFESKNFSGWIFGSENQKYWTQTWRSGQKERFYNPIMQNQSHIKWLKKYLGEQYTFHSIVAFSDRCMLAKINLTTARSIVINRYDVLKTVTQIVANTGYSLSLDEINSIYDKLYPLTQVDAHKKQQHIDDIMLEHIQHSTVRAAADSFNQEQIQNEETNSASSGLESNSQLETDTEIVTVEKRCPKCGATLVKRVAARGENKGKEFYGCSNFPKCRYIENIEEN